MSLGRSANSSKLLKSKITTHERKKRGNKMVEITIRLWSNPDKGQQFKPKHVWASGTVNTPANELHGIKPLKNPVPFSRTGTSLGDAVDAVISKIGLTFYDDLKGSAR